MLDDLETDNDPEEPSDLVVASRHRISELKEKIRHNWGINRMTKLYQRMIKKEEENFGQPKTPIIRKIKKAKRNRFLLSSYKRPRTAANRSTRRVLQDRHSTAVNPTPRKLIIRKKESKKDVVAPEVKLQDPIPEEPLLPFVIIQEDPTPMPIPVVVDSFDMPVVSESKSELSSDSSPIPSFRIENTKKRSFIKKEKQTRKQKKSRILQRSNITNPLSFSSSSELDMSSIINLDSNILTSSSKSHLASFNSNHYGDANNKEWKPFLANSFDNLMNTLKPSTNLPSTFSSYTFANANPNAFHSSTFNNMAPFYQSNAVQIEYPYSYASPQHSCGSFTMVDFIQPYYIPSNFVPEIMPFEFGL